MEQVGQGRTSGCVTQLPPGGYDEKHVHQENRDADVDPDFTPTIRLLATPATTMLKQESPPIDGGDVRNAEPLPTSSAGANDL